VVRDGVDERVPRPPELVEIAGTEVAGGRFAHPRSIGSGRGLPGGHFTTESTTI
jgi:hypothetical protein